MDSVTNLRGLFQIIDNDSISTWQFAASALIPTFADAYI
ncbi:hypothetical protein CEV32_4699 [Brucella rhizosphaerae]|uniref:Uncharacterized protein n=1 Tax=Brucella rhizosphaerae TaxID=571254 RepID=A0A256FKQ7_9HYPH|nr:hypothetical protein CEV32_4699 [Brucella rhizosphaerae]